MNENTFRTLYGFQDRKKDNIFKRFRLASILPTKQSIFRLFPILTWLLKYKKSWLLSDIITGITIGVMQIPQGMAYSNLAGLPPVYGLYTAFFPALLYTIFGTSRHLSQGAYALTSLMIAPSLEATIPDVVDGGRNTTANASNIIAEEVMEQRVLLANLITFVIGILLLLSGVFHLGFLSRLLSRPLQSGFIFGVTLLTIVSQFQSLFGVNINSAPSQLYIIWVCRDVILALSSLDAQSMKRTTASVVTSFISISFLLSVKFFNGKYKEKMPYKIPVPGELILVILGTFLSWITDLEDKFSLPTVGPIPSGIPTPKLPTTNFFSSAIIQSISVAIVGYSVVISLAQQFAERGCYKIRPNQELLAFGASNMFGSFFSCIPSFSAMSRSCVQFESGGKTQIAGLVSSFLMLFVLLFLGPLFSYLPKACLASVVVVAVSGLLRNAYQFKRYLTNHRPDAITWLFTCIITTLLHVTLGLLCGVIFSLLSSLFQIVYVSLRQLQRIDDTEVYREKGLYEKSVSVGDHVMLVKFHGPLNYLNSVSFRKSVIVESGIDPSIKTKQNTDRQKTAEQQFEETAICESSGNEDNNKKNKTFEGDDHSGSETDQTSFEVTTQSLNTIILECSGISAIDAVGADTLSKIISDYKCIGVRFLLASCSENILKRLHLSDEYDVTKITYVTVHEAIKSTIVV